MDRWTYDGWTDGGTDRPKNDIVLAHPYHVEKSCIHFEKVYACLNIELDFL